MTKNPFIGLSWPEKTTFSALCASLVAIVAWWRIGIYAITVLCAVSVFKMIYTRKIINRSLSSAQKTCLLSMIAYWILYALSAMVSTNHSEGWNDATIKLYFLVLPLICLLGDTSYLTPHRIKALFQIFVAALILRFITSIAFCGIQLLQGVPFVVAKDLQNSPIGIHHNYLALYIVIAIAFLYSCLFNISNGEKKRHWILLTGIITVLTVYLFINSSRSGIVSLGVLFVACMLHITFSLKKYKIAIGVFLFAAILSSLLFLSMPYIFNRFTALYGSGTSDPRSLIWQCGMKASNDHIMFGHGSGDYKSHLMSTYEEMGFTKGIIAGFNAHNQFIETLLATGVIGLTILLTMFFLPLVAALRNKPHNLFVILSIIVIVSQIFFESMLIRQMGVQFIALILCVLIISLSQHEQNLSESPLGKMTGH